MNGIVVLLARGFYHTVYLRITGGAQTHITDAQHVFRVRCKVGKIRPLDATRCAVVLDLSRLVICATDGINTVVAQMGQIVHITEIGWEVFP
jgi:hypothetical protein